MCLELMSIARESVDDTVYSRAPEKVPTILKHKDVEQACVAGALPYAQVQPRA